MKDVNACISRRETKDVVLEVNCLRCSHFSMKEYGCKHAFGWDADKNPKCTKIPNPAHSVCTYFRMEDDEIRAEIHDQIMKMKVLEEFELPTIHRYPNIHNFKSDKKGNCEDCDYQKPHVKDPDHIYCQLYDMRMPKSNGASDGCCEFFEPKKTEQTKEEKPE